MKQLILIFSFLFCLSISGYSQRGGSPPPKGRTSQPPFFVVSQNPSGIEVSFTTDLGNVTITVCNSEGVIIYENEVNAVSGGKLTIDTNQWANGIYTLKISYNAGIWNKEIIIDN